MSTSKTKEHRSFNKKHFLASSTQDGVPRVLLQEEGSHFGGDAGDGSPRGGGGVRGDLQQSCCLQARNLHGNVCCDGRQ